MTSIKNCYSSFISRAGAVALIALVSLCFGCNEEEPPVKDYISFHAYSWERNLGNIQQPIEVVEGRTVYIRRIPLVSSAQITRINTYDVVGGKGICCSLSSHGSVLWQAAAEEFRGRYAVMLIDGEFQGFVRMGMGRESGAAFCLDGPFSDDQANRMSENAQKIYMKKHNLIPEFWKLNK